MPNKKVEEIRKKLESQGMVISNPEFELILKHTLRKMELCGKSSEYLPLLLEDEIKEYFFRLTINAASLLMMALA